MFGLDRVVYVSIICLQGPQRLVDTVAPITQSTSPSISIFKSPLLLIFGIESTYMFQMESLSFVKKLFSILSSKLYIDTMNEFSENIVVARSP